MHVCLVQIQLFTKEDDEQGVFNHADRAKPRDGPEPGNQIPDCGRCHRIATLYHCFFDRRSYSPWLQRVAQLCEQPQPERSGMDADRQLPYLWAAYTWIRYWASTSPANGPEFRLGPILPGVFSLALIVSGLIVTDPSLGYPAGTHSRGPQTLHGTIHGVAGLITFSSLAIASFVMARCFAGDPNWKGWTLYSNITGTMVAVFFIASTVVSALDENGVLPGSPTGLLQRIAIIVGWSWIALLAMWLLGKMRPS